MRELLGCVLLASTVRSTSNASKRLDSDALPLNPDTRSIIDLVSHSRSWIDCGVASANSGTTRICCHVHHWTTLDGSDPATHLLALPNPKLQICFSSECSANGRLDDGCLTGTSNSEDPKPSSTTTAPCDSAHKTGASCCVVVNLTNGSSSESTCVALIPT